MSKQNKPGRPSLSENDVDTIFQKIESHLKSGLSLHKACLIAKIPKSTVYDLRNSSREFSEKIDLAQSYQSILVSSIVNNELEKIEEEQNKSPKGLSRDKIRFVQWVAINSKSTKEEFNRDDNTRDDPPENRIQQLAEENPKVLGSVLKVYEAVSKNIKEMTEENRQKALMSSL